MLLELANLKTYADSGVKPEGSLASPAQSQATMALLASIVDSSDDAIIAKTPDGIITSWNHGAECIFGYTAAEIVGKSILLLAQPERPNEMPDLLRQIRNGERIDHRETTRVRKDGKSILVSVTLSPIYDSDGEVVGVSSIARDITERKRVDEAVRAASLYARSLIEASLDPLVMISPEGKITDVNESFVKVTGITREKVIGTDFCDYFTEPDRAREGYQQVFSKGSVTDYPLSIRHKDGALTDVLYNASLYKSEHGDVLGVVGAARDVTQQKQVSQYARSLLEKEVLLQEVHHRVKNNLQVISSLINMQMRKLTDTESRVPLQECQNRVLAIALIHEKLYQSKNYAGVPFSDYARSLAASIFNATGVSPGNVELSIDFENISLAVDKAIPCGLILNELITNALKHAFPNDRKGALRIELRAVGTAELELVMADDGAGMDANFEIGKSKSLGMQLVTTLVEQLEGKLDISHGNGTTFRIRFPLEASA